MVCRPHVYSREGFQPTIKGSIVYRNVRAAPHNSARSLRQDFCSNSKFRKWRNTVCISHFRNCGSGAKRRLRLADAIVRCCLKFLRSNGIVPRIRRMRIPPFCVLYGNTTEGTSRLPLTRRLPWYTGWFRPRRCGAVQDNRPDWSR